MYSLPVEVCSALQNTLSCMRNAQRPQPDIVLAGGGSLVEGLPERLCRELRMNTTVSRERKYAQFIGAAVYSGSWVTDGCGFCK